MYYAIEVKIGRAWCGAIGGLTLNDAAKLLVSYRLTGRKARMVIDATPPTVK